jgi:hypothetical protein
MWRFPREALHALRQSQLVVRDGGVSAPRQLLELIRLRAGPGKLTPEDYFLMRVYQRRLSFEEKAKFVSTLALGALRRDRRWDLPAHDKLLTYGLLHGHGIAVPEIVAIAHPSRTFGGRPALKSPAELEAYLAGEASYPFFAKPVLGIFSKGSMLVKEMDRAGRSLLLGDGSRVAIEAFAREVFERKSGYLFQELLHPHPEIADLTGDRLCTVRVMLLYDERGPRLYRAMWKVATGGNMADNYWRKGNILCSLDKEKGEVLRCTTGLGPDMCEVESHRQTGERLLGFVIPQWDALLDLTDRAARIMPGLPVQAWDIAPTSKGPVALEVNVFGSLFLPQVAAQRGLYEGEFRAFVETQRH